MRGLSDQIHLDDPWFSGEKSPMVLGLGLDEPMCSKPDSVRLTHVNTWAVFTSNHTSDLPPISRPRAAPVPVEGSVNTIELHTCLSEVKPGFWVVYTFVGCISERAS